MDEPVSSWVDGLLVGRSEAALPPTDSAFASGRGCYTTARYRAGRVCFLERHAARLVRDARRLGIGELEVGRVGEGLVAAGRAAFGDGEDSDGVVRIQASRDAEGRAHLTAVPRRAGPEAETWTAIRAPFAHEGPMPWSGAKVTNHLLFALATDAAHAQGVDEALLVDREGYLVEGSRSNLLMVDTEGSVSSPDPSRGGVCGVGLEVLRERAPEIRSRHIAYASLRGAREVIAVNAVRGPRPIVEIDGQPIGNGARGAIAARLESLFRGTDRSDDADWSPQEGYSRPR